MTRRVWGTVVIVTVSLVYLLRLDRTAGLMIDDAWYLVLAKALASGDGYRLTSSAAVAIMPVVPPGFPALLAPVFAILPNFPDNLLLLKMISIAAMAGVGVATYRYLTQVRPVEPWVAAAVTVATLLTPALVFLATSTVMAEAAFTLTQLVAVILLDRSRADGPADVRRTVLAGMAMAAAVIIRSAGVAMLLGGVLYLLHQRSWRRLAVFAGTGALCLAPWLIYSAAHAPTAEQSASHGGTIALAYADLLAMRRAGNGEAGRASVAELPARVAGNAVNVFGRDLGGVFVPGLYRGASESGEETVSIGGAGASMGSALGTMVVSFGLSGIVLLGLIVNLRSRGSAADTLVIASFAMILLVSTRTFRYVLPLAPFLWLYLATGLRSLASLIERTHVSARPNQVALHRVLFLSLIALQLQDHVQYARLKVADPPAAHWLHDARAVDEVLAWVEGNLPAGAPLASTNPGLVYLRTGRTGVVSVAPASHVDEWKAIGIHYMVALQPTAPPPKSLGFRRLYEHQRLWVVEF